MLWQCQPVSSPVAHGIPIRSMSAWRPEPFDPPGEATDAADVALDALRRRGSPSHDGLAARLVDFETLRGGCR